MTARRMTSGELLKERKGVCITRGDEALRPGSNRFTLTMPVQQHIFGDLLRRTVVGDVKFTL